MKGKLGYVQVSGVTLYLPLPDGGGRKGRVVTPPKVQLYGRRYGKAQSIEKRARRVLDEHGLAVLGPTFGHARWVPEPRIPKVEEDLRLIAAEAEAFNQEVRAAWPEIQNELLAEVTREAKGLGLGAPPPEWVQAILEAEPPRGIRMELKWYEITSVEEVQIVKGTLSPRVESLAQRFVRAVTEELTEAARSVAEALRSGGERARPWEALERAVTRAEGFLAEARGMGLEEEEGLAGAVRMAEVLRAVAKQGKALRQAVRFLKEALRSAEERNILPRFRVSMFCSSCGKAHEGVTVTAHNLEAVRCPTCKSGNVIVYEAEESG